MKKIGIAFFLNLGFSVFELVGGFFTGSVAILSDAFHDAVDALSIGVSYWLEKKSEKAPDAGHTYGYRRYGVLGGFLTTALLIIGSLVMIVNAAGRLLDPTPIHYTGMILFAVVGLGVNLAGALVTREGESVNQRAVNLHMLEDVLGWAVVLAGSFVMKLADIPWLDPVLSIAVSVFILIKASGNLKEIADLFLEKTPAGLSVAGVCESLCGIDGVEDVHHVHIWSLDGEANYATAHVVTGLPGSQIKPLLRQRLKEQGISHVTLELETPGEECAHRHCHVPHSHHHGHHHHHHHH